MRGGCKVQVRGGAAASESEGGGGEGNGGGGDGGGGDGGGGDGGGDGGGGEGALNTCDEVPTPLTEAMFTPRFVESWAVLPWSADVDV